jgi:hypothetical protein
MKAYIPGRGLSVWRWYATPCRIHQPYHRPLSRFRPLGPPSLPLPSLQSPRPIQAYTLVGIDHGISNSANAQSIHKVSGFLSSRPHWVHHPLTRKQVLPPPPLVPRGEDMLAMGEGAGGTYSKEGTDTLVFMYTIIHLRCNVSGSPLFSQPDDPDPLLKEKTL